MIRVADYSINQAHAGYPSGLKQPEHTIHTVSGSGC
jgi:hypothetical protein